jgi:hypothetical protein
LKWQLVYRKDTILDTNQLKAEISSEFKKFITTFCDGILDAIFNKITEDVDCYKAFQKQSTYGKLTPTKKEEAIKFIFENATKMTNAEIGFDIGLTTQQVANLKQLIKKNWRDKAIKEDLVDEEISYGIKNRHTKNGITKSYNDYKRPLSDRAKAVEERIKNTLIRKRKVYING